MVGNQLSLVKEKDQIYSEMDTDGTGV